MAEDAASSAAIAMAFGGIVEFLSVSLAACACRALDAGKDGFLRIGRAPAPHAGHVALVLVEVHRDVTGLLVEPPAHEAENRRASSGTMVRQSAQVTRVV